MRRVLHVAMLWAAWLGLWLLLVENFSAAELVVGAVCALVAALASVVAWGDHLIAFAANPRLLAQAWRLPGIAARDVVTILEVLALHLFTRRKAHSLLRVVPFDAGDQDDRDATTRRALAIAYSTMTPNCVVIGIDREKQTMLYHQLASRELSEMARKLGARP